VEFEPTPGVTLVGDEWGPAGPEVLLLGGAGQTRQAWGATGSRLGAAGFHAQAFDHRGHGESTWVGPGGYEMDAFVDDTASLALSTPEPPAIVGASLGGLAALIGIGLRRSVRATALVLVDIAPRIEMSGARRVLSFMAAYPDGFESLDAASRAIARYLNRDRPPRTLDLPTLLVRGGLSDVVSQEGADEFLRAAPQARFVDVTDAGHMVAGDQNDIFGDVIVDFLTEVRR